MIVHVKIFFFYKKLLCGNYRSIKKYYYVDITTYQRNLELFCFVLLNLYLTFWQKESKGVCLWFIIFKSFLYMLMRGVEGKKIL